jgi:CRP/FNR family transcriptional regulator
LAKGSKNHNINHEHQQGCFSLLNQEEYDFLVDKKTEITYLKGEILFKQGSFAPHVLFVNQGLVRVYIQIHTGQQKKLNIKLARQGDIIAFSSVFSENVHRYSAIALKDSKICMIEKSALTHLIRKNEDFALKITTRNSRHENHCLDIIQNISFKQMRGKLASALLYLSSPEFVEEDVFNYLTRQEIADFASITLESAVRFLKEFREEGILDLEGKKIKVLDRKALQGISEKG